MQEAKDFYTSTGITITITIIFIITLSSIIRICPISKAKEKETTN
jgi:hypothetical protein